jgi:hypothetical protein
LRRYKTLPKARCSWALDSGAFSEISKHGKWTLSPEEYVAAVRRYRDEIGKLAWAAPQDWMCEPHIVAATGLSVREHQERTVENLVQLRALAPDLPFIPAVQGWNLADYLRCVEMYRERGIDLRDEPLVGLGSVCRRQATNEIGEIAQRLAGLGLRLHGFGVKTSGLRSYGQHLASADSLAWSFGGRYAGPCQHQKPGRKQQPASEANCLPYALEWRQAVLRTADPRDARRSRGSGNLSAA